MKYQKPSKHTFSVTSVLHTKTSGCTACIIESNPLAAEYLAGILRRDPDVEVCFFDAYVNSGARGVPLIFCLDQTDAVLPLRASLSLLKAAYPDSKCILLGAEANSDHLRLLLDSDIHGVLKLENVKEWLLEAVRSVSRGMLWVHPEFAQGVSRQSVWPEQECIPEHARPDQAHSYPTRTESLTRRETEILQLVNSHFSNKEISVLLEIEESTVKFHLSNILAKRNVSRREDLAASRLSEGWRALLTAGAGTANPVLRSLLR